MPAYDSNDATTPGEMRLHFDDDEHRIRVCSCLTEDGKPRKVGMQDMAGGRVYVTYVRADGSVEEFESEPGALLIFWVPSGGFYAMSVSDACMEHAPPRASMRPHTMQSPHRDTFHASPRAGPRLRRCS